MLATLLFYLIVLLTVIWGFKVGLTRAGKLTATLFVIGYFPLWTLEATLRACGSVPAGYAKFMPATVFLVEAVIGAVVMGAIWKKLAERYPALDDSPTMIGMPRLNAVCGAILGCAAGFLLAAMIFCLAALLPVEIPLLGRRNVVLRARGVTLGEARFVNALALCDTASVEKDQQESIERQMKLPEAQTEDGSEPNAKIEPKKSAPPRRIPSAAERTAVPTLSQPRGSSSVYGNAIQRAKKTTRDAEKSRSNLDEYQ